MNQKTDISTLSLAIMGLIAQKPQSGYDIRKTFATTPMGHFSNSPGAIYPALKRLEKDGWVRGKVDSETVLRPRKVYELTRSGRAALKRYLAGPVTRDDVIWRMEDLMLRFALMDGIVGRAATLALSARFCDRTGSVCRAPALLSRFCGTVNAGLRTAGDGERHRGL